MWDISLQRLYSHECPGSKYFSHKIFKIFIIYLSLVIIDIDECKSRPCDQVCTNRPGSYTCSCRTGYKKINNNPTSRQCVSKFKNIFK